MADLAAIEKALRAADAAGNTEDARRLAQAYAEARNAQAGGMVDTDFGPRPANEVFDIGAQRQQKYQRLLAANEASQPSDPMHPSNNPTTGMSGFDKFMSGVGKSVYDTGRGLLQLGGGMSREEVDAQQQQDAALMDTGAGIAGNVSGTIGQVLIPGGAAARYASMAPKVAAGVRAVTLPKTILGTMAQGAAMGGMQAVGTDDSRLGNMLLGTAAGGAGAIIPRAVGAGYRGTRETVGRFTQKGANSRAVQQVLREAENPAALLRPQPSGIPGVNRTLAQESLDPGVARLERNMRSTVGGFDQLDSAANTARAEAIRKTFEGASPQAASGIRAARDQAANAALDMLPNAGFVEKKGIQAALKDAIKKNQGNPATQAALQDALKQMPDIRTASQAYNFRKYIDFLVSKQSDKPALKMAKRELMGVKGAVDDAMVKAFPGWQSYLDDYVAQSRRADQATAGSALLRKGSAIPDPVTGDFPLSPAQISRVVSNPDAFAAQVTRFPQATAAKTFTPKQTGLLGLLGDDMTRVNATRTMGSGGNSQTFERMALQDRAATSMAGGIPIVGRFAAEISKIGDRKVQEAVARIIANPAEYRSLVAAMPAGKRMQVDYAISRITGGAGAMAPALTE